MSESIPLDMLTDHIKQQQEEKLRLEEEIKQRRAILENINVDIMTLNEYKKLEEELHKHGFSMKHPHNPISVLQTISQIGYESRMKSLRQKERQLIHSCKVLESHLHKEVLPWCEEIVRLGNRNEELLIYHIAVCEKAEMLNISRESVSGDWRYQTL